MSRCEVSVREPLSCRLHGTPELLPPIPSHVRACRNHVSRLTPNPSGQISSADDWYLLGSGLVVTETSLDTFDHNRYNASYGCTTSSLLSWQRVLAANMLAADGPGWAAVAAAYNGGGSKRGSSGCWVRRAWGAGANGPGGGVQLRPYSCVLHLELCQ